MTKWSPPWFTAETVLRDGGKVLPTAVARGDPVKDEALAPGTVVVPVHLVNGVAKSAVRALDAEILLVGRPLDRHEPAVGGISGLVAAFDEVAGVDDESGGPHGPAPQGIGEGAAGQRVQGVNQAVRDGARARVEAGRVLQVAVVVGVGDDEERERLERRGVGGAESGPGKEGGGGGSAPQELAAIHRRGRGWKPPRIFRGFLAIGVVFKTHGIVSKGTIPVNSRANYSTATLGGKRSNGKTESPVRLSRGISVSRPSVRSPFTPVLPFQPDATVRVATPVIRLAGAIVQ